MRAGLQEVLVETDLRSEAIDGSCHRAHRANRIGGVGGVDYELRARPTPEVSQGWVETWGDYIASSDTGNITLTPTLTTRPPKPRPAFAQNQYGANLGGPVIKNQTFFFVSWEGFRLRQGFPFLVSVPTAQQRAGDFSNTRTAGGSLCPGQNM
jgi:hypothetical protein